MGAHESDIITLHDYAEYGEDLLSHWTDWEQNLSNTQSFNGERYAFAGGFRYEGQPIILSEFGGIAFCKDEKRGDMERRNIRKAVIWNG